MGKDRDKETNKQADGQHKNLILWLKRDKYQYLCIKPCVVGTDQNCLSETNLISAHNIGFGTELMDIDCRYSLLSKDLVTSFTYPTEDIISLIFYEHLFGGL